MAFLWIIGVLILIITLIFSLNLKLYIKFADELYIRLGIGPYVKTITPKKQKSIKLSDFTYEKFQKRLAKEKKLSKKKAAKKALKAEKKKKAQQLCEKAESAAAYNGADSAVNKLLSVIDIIKFVTDEFPKFASFIKIRIKALHIIIGGDEAGKIATTYGAVNAAVSLFIELLKSKTSFSTVKPGEVTVNTDFLQEKTKFDLDMSLKISVFSIIRVGFDSLIWLIKMKIKQMKT